jgi:hypothetical protein
MYAWYFTTLINIAGVSMLFWFKGYQLLRRSRQRMSHLLSQSQ